MEFNINQFNEYREDNRLEVKKADGGLPHSLWETYSSMANSEGGLILLGVGERENGQLYTTGLKNPNKLIKTFWDTVNNKSKVSINILTDADLKTYKIENDVIIAINIPRAIREDKPVYINNDLFGGTYRRNGEGDYHCSPSEVKAMLRDQPESTSDMKVLENMEISDLNFDTLHAYRNRHEAVKPGHVWLSYSDERYLEELGAVRRSNIDHKLHPTGAGLLMFGNEYKILYEYPDYFLDYREMLDPSIRWTDRLQSSSGDWSGNLFDFYFRVINKLLKDIKVPFKMEGITRVDDTPVAKALREALANCLVNTDFYQPRGVVILKDAEKIVMENPGYIRVGKSQMFKGGVSDPRNKGLIKMFNMIAIGERSGSGVPDILSIWNQQGWNNPMVEEQFNPDRTRLILPLVSKQAKKTSEKNKRIKTSEFKNKRIKTSKKTIENSKKILEYLAKHESASSTEISKYLGLSQARTRALLNNLNDSGDVIKAGNTKSRKYILAENSTKMQ